MKKVNITSCGDCPIMYFHYSEQEYICNFTNSVLSHEGSPTTIAKNCPLLGEPALLTVPVNVMHFKVKD